MAETPLGSRVTLKPCSAKSSDRERSSVAMSGTTVALVVNLHPRPNPLYPGVLMANISMSPVTDACSTELSAMWIIALDGFTFLRKRSQAFFTKVSVAPLSTR